ncbi:extracellular solute-binding protein [bacterium]|nr:extracellular solute-binding protein [bacterium]
MIILSLVLAACGSKASQPAATTAPEATEAPAAQAAATEAPVAAATTVTEWDYQNGEPQFSQWQAIIDGCAAETGITIDRQAFERNELIQRVLLGAQQGDLPGVLRIDNPDLQQIADTGALAPLTDYGVDLTGLYPNLVEAGSYNGEVYGIAPGINGMAIFYNKDMFEAAGIEIPTTWAELKDAAVKLTKDGVYGIAFSAPATEEGSWQFEPWFWGAGADLKKLDSPEGIKALEFWTDLVNSGAASQSVVQWTQGDVNDQFMSGNAAMQQNGVWNLAALKESGINFGIFPIPAPDGGAAPGPMGGEVLTIPVNEDPAVMQAAGKVLNCLLADKSMLEWSTLNAYIPSRQSLAEQVAAEDPFMAAFVQAAAAELSRTGPPANLGPNYSKVSQPLWVAIQAALTGAKTPADALKEAQMQAEAAQQ